MNEPIRHKNKTVLKLEARYKEIAEPVRLYAFANRNAVEQIPKEVLEKKLQEDLKKVSIAPVSGIYQLNTSFSYEDPDFLKEFDHADTLIEINLPYCLHIPNQYELTVSLPEHNLDALVIFNKVWTQRAREDGKESDVIDFFAEDRPIYFNHSTMLTPKLPMRPDEGWDGYFTGRNMERMKDQNGIFRYTKLFIQFNTNPPEGIAEMKKGQADLLLKSISEKALAVVNKIIDSYRDLTKEAHIRRLGNINIVLVYFIKPNCGYYTLSPNLETAIINRSQKEISAIKDQLSNAYRPELYKMLLLDAQNSYDTNDYKLAIVESFQAFEIFLEHYLIAAFEKKGDGESVYWPLLQEKWQTKERLNSVLKNAKGISLNTVPVLWDVWCTRYDKTRNDVLHGGKDPSKAETKETIDINERVINWLQSI